MNSKKITVIFRDIVQSGTVGLILTTTECMIQSGVSLMLKRAPYCSLANNKLRSVARELNGISSLLQVKSLLRLERLPSWFWCKTTRAKNYI